MDLMEQVVANENVVQALEHLERKPRKAPGIDGMRIPELRPYLRANWLDIRGQLLRGEYQPQPVKRAEIPKPGGGKRPLGIPTVLDRFIQTALLQVLTPIFEPTFSNWSYGYRPNRSAHQAVQRARKHIQQGNRWVVDMDLSKFFDRVNHDMLMARVARHIRDPRVLRLIRRYLQAGVMMNGVVVELHEGTPQGGPLSPLLSNIVLTDLDRELARRGHRFVRYADDFQVYVGSRRAAERVLKSLTRFVEQDLKLKVNREKSAVDRAWKRTLLGFGFYVAPGRQVRLRLAASTLNRCKRRIRELTARNRGVSIQTVIADLNQFLRGWLGYYQLADCRQHLRDLAEWLRRRLRLYLLKQWKRPRTRVRQLRGLGVPEVEARKLASSGKGYWALARTPQLNQALPNRYWVDQGLVDLLPTYLAYR